MQKLKSAASNYKGLIGDISLALRPLGFRRSQSLLVRELGDAKILVEFQRSRRSTRDTVLFCINVAVSIDALRGVDMAHRKPTIDDADWRIRLGAEPGSDHWWSVNDSPINPTKGQIVELIVRLMPELERLAQPANLLTLWKSGSSPGLTNVQRDARLHMLAALDILS